MATVEQHIGTVNWQVNLQLSSLRTLRMTSTHMFLDLVDPLDTDLLAAVEHLHNLSLIHI